MTLRRSILVTALAASVLAAPAFAQNPPKAPSPPPPPRNYLDEAVATGEKTGGGFADANEKVDGPKTVAGTKSYQSAVPFFKDLKAWDPNYKPPRTSDGRPDLQGVWSTASLTTMSR